MKHIIVEGPDGSGKGNLIRDLTAHLGLPIHPRFVQSTGGPPLYLDHLVEQDVATPAFNDRHHSWIYDRHPVISEPIYGPIIRGKSIGSFAYPSWLERMRLRVGERCVVVFCLPPYTEVFNNVHKPIDGIVHMDGVEANIEALYQAYNVAQYEWPGASVIHNYVMNPPGSSSRGALIARIRRMAQEGELEWRTNPR